MITITDQIVHEIETSDEWADKMAQQFELEEKMRTMGIDRFWANAEKAREKGQETNTKPVRRLLDHSVVPVTKGIEAFLRECESGKAGKKHTAYHLLKKIEPEVAAYLTCRVVLDGVAKGDKLVTLARRVASLIEDELAFRAFRETDRQTFDWLVKREKRVNGSCYRRQRLSIKHNMNARGIESEEWSPTQAAHVGTKLIEIMIATTGLVEQVTRTTDVNKTVSYVVATQQTMEWLMEESSRCAVMSPMYLPTIVPPRPWTSPFEGGYWSGRVRNLVMVKTHNKGYLEELAEHDMPEVYDAINAMQHTAWRINEPVLETLRALWEQGSTLGKLPSAEDIELPLKPLFLAQEKPKEEWTEEELVQFKRWKREATDTHARNAKLKSLRLQLAKVLSLAEMFADQEEIYFPHQFDFRGRCYAVPMFLNPQGSDVAKGLLEFANAVAIRDEEGHDWLCIHGANSYGYDKVSLRDRVRWVKEHEAAILASAENPLDHTFWAEADKPFQFLAFCFDYAGFKAEGYGYLSCLPIQMDGSCNGLQNFSAMLRDAIGGAAVNLLPSDLPSDIYQKVADLVLKRVEQDALSDDEKVASVARGWLKHGVDRKVCKRPVMTLAYGAKEFGFKTQVFEDTVQPYKYKVGPMFPWEGSGWDAADYMGKLIWDCVAKVVVAARQAMDWLQKAARQAAKEGLPVRWTTPDGFVVLQAYAKPLSKKLDVTFNGARLQMTVATGYTTELDKSKQANGISPNWVHSMDAAHMRATIRRAWDEGLRSYSLIHDSYGTHAGNTWALARFLREEFVAMYEEDVMEVFRRDLALQLPDGVELDELPPKGTLDLEAVLGSVYFFA